MSPWAPYAAAMMGDVFIHGIRRHLNSRGSILDIIGPPRRERNEQLTLFDAWDYYDPQRDHDD